MRDAVNIEAVEFVAKGLAELVHECVFIGGAVLSLYADDPGAEMPRPTTDIDLVIELAGLGKFAKLEERLMELGFFHSPEDRILCRYRFHGILVDIQPTDVPGLGPTNKWFLPGIEHAVEYEFSSGTKIRLLDVAHFLGTKFEAAGSRGTDKRTSKDFEDIVFVLDSRKGLVEEVRSAPAPIKRYLKEKANELLKDDTIREAVQAHLSPMIASDRANDLIKKLLAITQA